MVRFIFMRSDELRFSYQHRWESINNRVNQMAILLKLFQLHKHVPLKKAYLS